MICGRKCQLFKAERLDEVLREGVIDPKRLQEALETAEEAVHTNLRMLEHRRDHLCRMPYALPSLKSQRKHVEIIRQGCNTVEELLKIVGLLKRQQIRGNAPINDFGCHNLIIDCTKPV